MPNKIMLTGAVVNLRLAMADPLQMKAPKNRRASDVGCRHFVDYHSSIFHGCSCGSFQSESQTKTAQAVAAWAGVGGHQS